MAGQSLQVKFRLDKNSETLLVNEARLRNLSVNQAASFLVKRALRDNSKSADQHLRLSATTTFQLVNFILLILQEVKPSLSREQVVELANNEIFTKARERTDALLKELGIED